MAAARLFPPYNPDRQHDVRALLRACISLGRAKLDGRSPTAHAEKTWPDDPFTPLVIRAAQAPTTAAGTPAIAHVVTAFLELLIPASAGAALLARGVKLNFDHAASIAVPGIALPTADFVAEGAPIPVEQAATSAVTITPRKIAAITTATGELLRNPSAEELLPAMLIEAVARPSA